MGRDPETPMLARATVAVLFARADSIYKALPQCDVWDEQRDARKWPGGCAVVAHPPCRAWSPMRHFAKAPKGERALATYALRQVRRWGGVLEHPAGSRLWSRCRLPAPGRAADAYGGWTIGITQHWWGHRAEKRTLLYVVGCAKAQVPSMPLVLGHAERVCCSSLRAGAPGYRKHLEKAERERTPAALAQWLVELAQRCMVRGEGAVL